VLVASCIHRVRRNPSDDGPVTERPTPHPLRAVLAMERIAITDLAAAIGVHRLTLTRWLDRRERVPLARRAQIAAHLGWDEADLFHPDDRTTTQEPEHVR
jgi:DNA-binding Xre family transcriptional regulator